MTVEAKEMERETEAEAEKPKILRLGNTTIRDLMADSRFTEPIITFLEGSLVGVVEEVIIQRNLQWPTSGFLFFFFQFF